MVYTFVFLWLFARYDDLTCGTSIAEILWRPLLVMLPVIGLAALASPHLHLDVAALSPRWDAFVELLVCGGIFAEVLWALRLLPLRLFLRVFSVMSLDVLVFLMASLSAALASANLTEYFFIFHAPEQLA